MDKAYCPRKRLMLLLVFAGSATSGCTTGFVSPEHPFDYIYGKTSEELKANIITKAQLAADEKAYYDLEPTLVNESKRRQFRDKIVGELRVHIDEFWRRFRSSFYGANAATKTGFEGTTSVLSGAAAITTPPSAASILSALSSAVGAIGTSADKNFFQQQTTPVLLQQMDADVKLYGTKIDQGLGKTTDKYTLPHALADLAAYSQAMSIPSALASLNASSGAMLQAFKEQEQRKLLADK